MYEEDRTLMEQCERLAREMETASHWVTDHRDLVGRDMENHNKFLRKTSRFFKSCATAAGRRMCAGVFGPSQAGKSYLVSTLAGNAERKLWTLLGDRAYDFLSEINPAGGKESTGLVTRFTLARSAATQPDFPVHIRLLSYIDVVKILSNTYFSDAEHMETPDREALLASLESLEKRASANPTGGITTDDVEDLQEYIHKYFRSKPRVQLLLNQPFWDRIIPLAPLLEDDDRAELFGLIWDSIGPFTQLLRELGSSLRSIGFPADAFCPVNALIPRERSIIDVATLGSLTPENDDLLNVTTPNGKTALLPRVYVTALTAELIIPMQDQPADFFAHTDLLDFPGYRSRKMFVDLKKESEDRAKLKECFLRGKVAYLFERYCAERELTSLLLCIGSGPQEVQGLGGAVNDWITGTHGETPERRTDRDTALFFILTKSDLEFEDKAGAKDVSERWDTRMYASMELFTSHTWLKEWNKQGAFNNFFLMRNPTVKLHLFTHDENGTETSLKEEMLPYVMKFEQAFKNSPLIQTHFAYRDQTWAAFLTPADGGLSLIRTRLAPICKPELKRNQITTTVEEQLSKIRDRLAPYWRTDDKDEERRQKEKLAVSLAKIILGISKLNKFGSLLRALTVKDQELFDLYFQTQYQIQERIAQPSASADVTTTPAAVLPSVEDDLAALFGESLMEEASPEAAASAQAPPVHLPKDEAQAFGEQIEKFWADKLRQLAEDPVFQRHFSFPPNLLSEFVHELAVGFVRLGARTTMETSIREHSRYTDGEQERRIWKLSALAANVINDYVTWLGFNPRLLEADKRTLNIGGSSRTVFTPPADFTSLPALAPSSSQDYISACTLDWVTALTTLIRENVNFDGVRDFDVEANNQLRRILDSLSLSPQNSVPRHNAPGR